MTEQQRDALLNYLLNQPYREVAGGVQFLTNAPTTVLNLEVPEEGAVNVSAEKETNKDAEATQGQEMRFATIPSAPEKEFAVLSQA
ncbi:MAG: hypothetical protein HC874_14350 [Richelia sp. SL_2_1]|nr:hypothetical protein [Richelia sp. SL_2_1]